MAATPASRIDSIRDVCLNTFFVAALLLPLAGQWSGIAPAADHAEKRELSPRPRLTAAPSTWRHFPRQFEAYFNDCFGFRPILIRWHSRLQYRLLRVSPSEKVVVGRDGWLFYRGIRSFHNEDPISDFRGARPLSPARLERWRHTLAARHEWLRARGISYVVVLVPNKGTIYPEAMHRAVPRRESTSPLQQVARRLADDPGLNVLDLRDVLVDGKAVNRVYLRTDTHWNHVGAFFAYRAIVERIRPLVPNLGAALELADFRPFYTIRQPGGDLAVLMGLEDIIREELLLAEPRAPWQAVDLTPNPGEDATRTLWCMETPQPHAPRAVVTGDSFINGLQPFLSEHFSRSVYTIAYGAFPEELIRREKPDIVIEEILERFLRREPRNPASWGPEPPACP